MAAEQANHGAYNCPNCGAGAAPDSVRCPYCLSGLATRVCLSCYGAIFVGMQHCPWCGGKAAAGGPREKAPGKCPRCDVDFLLVTVGNQSLSECPGCGGLWVHNDILRQICADQERRETVLGFHREPGGAAASASQPSERMYIPCPECKKLMNRRQFASGSGIVVDWCKEHGTWLDCDELRQIVAFIAAGGLHKSREREKAQLQEQRLHLRQEAQSMARLARLGSDPACSGNHLNRDADLLALLGRLWMTLRD